MKRTFLFFALASSAVALFVTPCRVPAQTGSIRQQLLGTWKLVSYVREDVRTGARSDVWGPHPSGYITFGPDGRMMVILVGSDRKAPAGSLATPDEAEGLIESMLAYAGTYTIDEKAKTLTYDIDVSWTQARTGRAVVRSYQLDGDRITLKTQAEADPATGEKTIRTVVFDKVK